MKSYAQVSPSGPVPPEPPNRITRSDGGSYAMPWRYRMGGLTAGVRRVHVSELKSYDHVSFAAPQKSGTETQPPNMITRSALESYATAGQVTARGLAGGARFVHRPTREADAGVAKSDARRAIETAIPTQVVHRAVTPVMDLHPRALR